MCHARTRRPPIQLKHCDSHYGIGDGIEASTYVGRNEVAFQDDIAHDTQSL